MPNPVQVLQNTPLWAFAVLAMLIVLGVQALRPRTVPVRRMFAVPTVFIIWGVITLATRSFSSPLLLLDWLIACGAGLAIVWRTAQPDRVIIDRVRGLVTVPGSAFPLVRNLFIFAAKYVLAVAVVVAPGLRSVLVPSDVIVSGLAAGYFIGWLLRFGLKFRSIGELEAVTSQ